MKRPDTTTRALLKGKKGNIRLAFDNVPEHLLWSWLFERLEEIETKIDELVVEPQEEGNE